MVEFEVLSHEEELVVAKCSTCGWFFDRLHSWEKPHLPNYCPNCGAKVVSE